VVCWWSLTGIREMIAKTSEFWEKPVMRQLSISGPILRCQALKAFLSFEATGFVEGSVIIADWTEQTLPSWLDSICRCGSTGGLVRFGPFGLIKSLREVPTLLLMRLAFGTVLPIWDVLRPGRRSVSERESNFGSTHKDSFDRSCCLIDHRLNPTPTG